uniref:Cytochrome P450 CYP6FJ1v2 n=1 Tax=Laodelphax striatellus TaxID=195883 RepID=K4JMN8_LAOST|nr:cytochrome P450 CYP6FJ1v2 [Laodelphax striatellus]
MDWLLTSVLAALIILLVYWLSVRRANYWQDRGFPHIKSTPIIGNCWALLRAKESFNDMTQNIYNQLKARRLQYGGFMQFSRPVLMVLDPELINTILIKDFTHFEDRGFTINEKIEPINANIANLSGQTWRALRYKLLPTFTTGKLKQMFDQIVYCSDNIFDYVNSKTEPFEAKLTMQKFNLNVIGTVAFGLNIDACREDPETERFLTLSIKFFYPSLKTILKSFFRMCSPKLSDLLRLRMIDDEVADFFTHMVRDTIAQRKQSGQRRNDFLQLMLDLQEKDLKGPVGDNKEADKEELEPDEKEMMNQARHLQGSKEDAMMTETRVIAHSFIFIAGGSETTANALNFCMYRLAVEKQVQTELQNEIDSVLDGQEFTYHSVKKMTYLDQFMNEVLRLHSPAGVLFRECTRSYKIPGSDLTIEKGAMISIPVIGLHNDPDYFPEPEKFNAHRFSSPPPKGVYLPFGDGPRNCIANRLALLEMKIFLARLLMKHNVILHQKTKMPLKMLKKAFFAVVDGGIWLQLEKREHDTKK